MLMKRDRVKLHVQMCFSNVKIFFAVCSVESLFAHKRCIIWAICRTTNSTVKIWVRLL